MADEPAVSLNNSWKIAVTLLALAFHAGIVVWLIAYGRADNSLHASALSWAFATAAGVLAGIGFGALAPLVTAIFKK